LHRFESDRQAPGRSRFHKRFGEVVVTTKLFFRRESMGEVTHEQANLLLRLYELRREQRMRDAREWYFANFHPNSLDDMTKQAPPGSAANASMRMVLSYWEMAASMVNRGLIDEDFFFENTGEQWAAWGRIKDLIPAIRERSMNPHQYGNLEKHVARFEAWREKRAPGSGEAIRRLMAQMRQSATQTKIATRQTGGKRRAKH
jgi:hypothetical protein